MKKKTKALAAGGLGAALLLGTGATFALWHDSAELDADVITTGELAIEVSPELVAGTVDLDEEWVPGDWAQLDVDAEITAVGDNLEWELRALAGEAAVVAETPLEVFVLVGDDWVPAAGTLLPDPENIQILVGFPQFSDGWLTDTSFPAGGQIPVDRLDTDPTVEANRWWGDEHQTANRALNLNAITFQVVQVPHDSH